MSMENLFKLLAQIAIELKLSKDANSSKEYIEKLSEKEPAPKPAEAAVILISLFMLIAGFIFLAFL